MPSATYAHAENSSQPIQAVWAKLQEAETWANIGPVENVSHPVHDGEHLRSFRWKTTVGPTRYDGSARVVAADEPRRMELALDAGEVAGSLVASLASNGDLTTHVEFRISVVSRGMLSTLFFPVVSEAIGRGFPHQVKQFVAYIDS